jgi:hypothetical protein
METKHERSFDKVLETDSITDIALIKSVLDAEGIEYFIQGETMRFIYPYDHAILFVVEEEVAKAVQLLKPLKLTYRWMTFT